MVQDTFPYVSRWDSVGLDCAGCTHFQGPPAWPDVNRVSACRIHELALDVELNPNGFKRGEWFCTAFAASAGGRTTAAALRHLDTLRNELRPDVLYGFYGSDGNLKEYPFSQLRRSR